MPGVFTPVVSAGLVSQQISGAAAIILGTGGGTNAAPVWSTIPTVTFVEGTALTVSMSGYCHDPDLDALTFSYNNATRPPGVVYDALSNSFIYDGRTGAASNYGGHILTANDGQGHVIASGTFSIQVIATVDSFTISVTRFPAPTGYGGLSGSVKHAALADIPATVPVEGGRLYAFGGDYQGYPAAGNPGYFNGNSGRQELGYTSVSQPNTWTLVYPYYGPDGDVQPYHPDEVGWFWDSARNYLWCVPGGMPQGGPNPIGYATNIAGMFYFDLLGTRKWTLVKDNTSWSYLAHLGYYCAYCPATDEAFHFSRTMGVIHAIHLGNALAGLPCERTINFTKAPNVPSILPYTSNDSTWSENICSGVIDGRWKVWTIGCFSGVIYELDVATNAVRVLVSGLPVELPFTSGPFLTGYSAETAPSEGHNNWLTWNEDIQRLEYYHAAHVQPDANLADPFWYWPHSANDDVGYITYAALIDPRARTIENVDPVVDGIRLRGTIVHHTPGVGTAMIGGSGAPSEPWHPLNPYVTLINYTPSVPAVPAVPQNVTASTTFTDRVDVGWSAVSGATGYNVYRSTTAGVTGSILQTVSNSSTYPDTSAVVGTDYYYSVAATNSGGASLPSAQVHGLRVAGAVAPVISGYAVSYTGYPSPLPFGGGSVTFTATITNTPTAVTLDGVNRLSSLTGTAFSYTQTVTLTKTFRLFASNAGGSTFADITVNVDAGTPTGSWEALTIGSHQRITPVLYDPATTDARAPASSTVMPNKAFTSSIMGGDGVWYYFGGAHGDYPGNEVDTCDTAAVSGLAMPWRDIAGPVGAPDRPHVPPQYFAPTTTEYSGAYQGGGPRVWSSVDRGLDANGVDPFQWDSTTADPDWQLGCKHTYCNQSWAPGYGLIVCGSITYPPYTVGGSSNQMVAWNVTSRWQAFPAQESANPNLQGRFMLSEYDASRNSILSFGIPGGSSPTYVNEWRLSGPDPKWYPIENVAASMVVYGPSSPGGGSPSVYLENGYHLIARLPNSTPAEPAAALVLYKPGLGARIMTIPADIATYVGLQPSGAWLGSRLPMAADRTNRIVYFAVTVDAAAPYHTNEIYKCSFDEIFATTAGNAPTLTQVVVSGTKPAYPLNAAGTATLQSASADRRPLHYHGGYLWLMLWKQSSWNADGLRFWRLYVG